MNYGSENYAPHQSFTAKGRHLVSKAFLGRGAFAECWEINDKNSGETFAMKIISKSRFKKRNSLDKIKREIDIHQKLKHENVVKFIFKFSDKKNFYMILEYCARNSLFELQRRRIRISEPEVRYFSKQILSGCEYLHSLKIIHRDLKLGNLLLSESLVVKIADFGIATFDDNVNQKKKICGTPNYIAPEVLRKEGHSFEVDIWSIGCIMYTLLVGRSPFQTQEIADTCIAILENNYVLPSFISDSVCNLIRKILADQPKSRPKIPEILKDSFFLGFTPHTLPISCLTTMPRFDQDSHFSFDSNTNEFSECKGIIMPNDQLKFIKSSLNELKVMLSHLLKSRSSFTHYDQLRRSLKPELAPIFWITRWVDNSDRYGLGYELSDSSCGLLFNDFTRLIMTKNQRNLQYIDRNAVESLFTSDNIPEWLKKKYILLQNHNHYMTEKLQKTGENVATKSDHMTRLPYLAYWKRSRKAILLFLSNGSAQINFFDDHEKFILCPIMGSLTLINSEQTFQTYDMNLLAKNGITKKIIERLSISCDMIAEVSELVQRSEVNEDDEPLTCISL